MRWEGSERATQRGRDGESERNGRNERARQTESL